MRSGSCSFTELVSRCINEEYFIVKLYYRQTFDFNRLNNLRQTKSFFFIEF